MLSTKNEIYSTMDYSIVLFLWGDFMKISKVNNTRTGIGLKDSKSSGIIYATPGKPDARKDIEKHIKALNERAKKLYSPFNSSSIMKCEMYRKKSRDEKQLCRKAENAIKRGCKDFVCDIAEKTMYVRKTIENALQSHSIVGKYSCIDEEFCQTIIDVSLKKSLTRRVKCSNEWYPVKEIMTKAVKIIANLSSVSELTEQESLALYTAIHEDYNKEKQIKKWVKSFENKDTKVQVVEVDGEKRLELSSMMNVKKKYISDFIHAYAGNTEQGKKDLLIHQRRLLLLYVCGQDTYYSSEHVDLMSDNWGGLLPEDNENISDTIYQLISSEDENLTIVDYDKMRMDHYGQAVKVEELSDNDRKWIGYFNEEVGKIFNKRKNRNNPVKIGSKYILKYLWKRWTSFIAMKYIDIGKAVYHFAMPQGMNPMDGKPVEYGVIQKEFIDGISSFDYERIKAKETIARDLAVYTTFAANIFSRATVTESYLENDKNEDALSLTKDNLDVALKSDTKRRILQYFGGISRWEKTGIINVEDKEFFMMMLQEIKIARNAHFHYSTSTSATDKVEPLIEKMFQFELDNAGYVFRKKYYSNNTLMFYKKDDIDQFMNRLYKKPIEREPQVPSFGNVFKKSDCKAFITQFVPGNKRSALYEGLDQFYASFYFMAKEIYYYDFLQLPDLKNRFLDALEHVNESEIKAMEKANPSKKNSKKEAKKNFKEYLDKYCQKMSFGELCQCVMTEYNQQNQNFKEVRTRAEKEKNKEIYQHFRMLLYATLKVAFEKFLKESEAYQFLKDPVYRPEIAKKISESEFCNDFSVGLFHDLEIVNTKNVYSWYVIAHFITAKQLNHLQGSIKDYLQFIKDIERRAESTCNKVLEINEQEQHYYEMLLKIFSVVMLQSGQISHEFEDYFASEEEYAQYLSKYVKYTNSEPSVALLKAFCGENILSDKNSKKKEKEHKKNMGNGFGDLQAIFAGKKEKAPKNFQKIGIYCDDMRPILNKNIIYSKLFGFEQQISDIFTVTRKDIEKYYTLKNKLEDTFKKEQCTTPDEQKDLREYQDIKNKVELYDVTTYTEIMIDCMAQLVSYAYLRERDNMYLQLGYHYVHLYYGKDVQENENTLLNISKGAILYQIYSIYNYDAAIIKKKGNEFKWGKTGQISGKIGQFVNCYSIPRYFDGMYFFENISMHDKITERRNYIDHMKYLSKRDTSILEMYGWMYNGFFDYDTKLKKSMSFILNNILMKYFVGIELKTERAERSYPVPKSQYADNGEKKNLLLTETQFTIDNVISERFIYKKLYVRDGNKSKPLEIDVRNKPFRDNVKSLLEMYGTSKMQGE